MLYSREPWVDLFFSFLWLIQGGEDEEGEGEEEEGETAGKDEL